MYLGMRLRPSIERWTSKSWGMSVLHLSDESEHVLVDVAALLPISIISSEHSPRSK